MRDSLNRPSLSMRRYLTLLSGQTVSSLGSALTGFALGVWVMQQTGSITQLSLIVTAATLPELLVLPFTGAIVDRYPRKVIMIVADTCAALATATVAVLLFAGSLKTWMIPILVACSAVAGGFQATAFQASARRFLSKEQLGRASGFDQIKQALVVVAAPALAGVLLGVVGIAWILIIDLASFLVAATVTLSTPFPKVTSAGDAGPRAHSLIADIRGGWRYLRQRPALVALLWVFGVMQFLIAFTTLLYTPLMLGFTTPTVLGVVMSVGAVGLLAGGLLVTWRGVPSHKIPWMLGGLFVGGLIVISCGLRPSAIWIAANLVVAMFLVPVTRGAALVLWQTKVAQGVQGRVFALQRMVARGVSPLAYLVAGPIADRVEPLLAEHGPLADSVGRLIGVGQGRGVALLLILTGIATCLLAVAAYANPAIRRVERQLPDAPADSDVEQRLEVPAAGRA